MNGHLETVAAVSAVVSAYHGGADLVKQLRKRSRRRKGEQAVKEKLLQEALESGEVQISQRYTQHYEELGPRFRVGDDAGREKLLHIAVVMQSELIRSLQIALQYENAVLDLTKLQEDAVMSRRDVLSALDDLRNRLLQQSSPQTPASRYTQSLQQSLQKRSSLESVQTYVTSQSGSSDFVPAGVKVPAEESKGGISRLFSTRKTSKRASTGITTAQGFLLPGLNWLSPAIKAEEHPSVRLDEQPAIRSNEHPAVRQPSTTEYELPAADVKRPVSTPEPQLLHPDMANSPPVSRHISTSTHNSTSTRSDFSDEKIPVLSEEHEVVPPNSPSTAVEIAGALPPQHFYRHHHSHIPSSSDASVMSPSSTVSTTSPLPSPAISINPDSVFGFQRRSVPRPVSSSTGSSSYGHRTSSIIPPTTSTLGPTAMLGRPSKDNSYWGFCKGAWTIREDWRKGLTLTRIPAGMYDYRPMWRCKHCAFEGEVFGAKKPYQVDPRIHTAEESGVRYRYLFLAKSHVKRQRELWNDTVCFGCVVCINDGKGTSIFGNVETLCNHLVGEHGRGEMTMEMQIRNRAVVGRVAEAGEEWDFNIPAFSRREGDAASFGKREVGGMGYA